MKIIKYKNQVEMDKFLRIEQKKLSSFNQSSKNNDSVFSKIKNKITHTYQNQKQILRQIEQTSTKNQPFESNLSNVLIPESKFTHQRTQSKDLSKKLKLKDYIRLNQISREKKSQSASATKIRKNKSQISIKVHETKTNLNPPTAPVVFQQQIKKQKKSQKKPYQKQIQLEKSQLMITTKKARQKFQKIMNLIEQTNDKFSSYNDLVFMFNIEELMNNFILKGMEEIRTAYSDHFSDISGDNLEVSTMQKIEEMSPENLKQTSNLSPAVRAQFKALQQIYLSGNVSKKKDKLPVSYSHSVLQFTESESDSSAINNQSNKHKNEKRLFS